MFTDKTIEVSCSECNLIFIGRDAIRHHVKTDHPDYGRKADYFADIWVEQAYENAEEFEKQYDEDRRLDKAIDADMDYQEHEKGVDLSDVG